MKNFLFKCLTILFGVFLSLVCLRFLWGKTLKIMKLISAGLAWGLMFGGPRLFSSRLSSLNYDNQVVHERVLSNEEFNLLDEDDRQVILAGIGDKPNSPATQGPSNFPIAPPHGRGSGKPLSGVNPYRTAPKLIDTGVGANTAGAGGAATQTAAATIAIFNDSRNLFILDFSTFKLL